MRAAPLGCPACQACLPALIERAAERLRPRRVARTGGTTVLALHALVVICPRCRAWLAVEGSAGSPRLARIPREIQALLLTGLLADGVPLEPVFAAAEEAGHAR